MRLLSFTLLLFFFTCSAMGQERVYPGDVDANGRVNHLDLLYLGIAYGETGPPRITPSIMWDNNGYEATAWEDLFSSGLDMVHADCDGNGVVEFEDLDAVVSNYKKNNPPVSPTQFEEGIAGVSPGFDIEPTTSLFIEGNPGSFTISLAKDISIDDFYGIAFTINYDTNLIKEGSAEFEFEYDPWIGVDYERIELIRDRPDEGIVEVSMSRIDQTISQGGGVIGTFSIIIEDNVIGFNGPEQMTLSIEKVKMINSSFGEINTPIAYKTIEVEVGDESGAISTGTENLLESGISIYPNPAKDLINIELPEQLNIDQVDLYTTTGKLVNCKRTVQENRAQLSISKTLNGIYFIKVNTAKGPIMKRILVE